MNEKGNRYALSALKNKRAALAAESVQLERQLRHRRESLAHVDACLRLLDPTLRVESIPNKRLPKHINLFRQGELGRLILGTLREADGKPLSPPEIVAAIMRKGGIDSDARNVLRVRVRSNLGYLERRGKVTKLGERKDAKWKL
jgi:hypothetical protein